ncbi:MAG: hypothetical protein LQ343_006282 [Gyalolechia ehrenbergii]|nr:MAG: hypothetical protein LQ343_006282 [Gyalolechia ehrenbergii]
MDLWYGDIDFDDGHKHIQGLGSPPVNSRQPANALLDLHFSHPHVQDASLPQHASLRFLGIGKTADIPLYLAAGPSLDVWTPNENTSEWLHDCLIDDASNDEDASLRPSSQRPGTQSQDGILLGVLSQRDTAAGKGLRITEILLYAATSRSSLKGYAPPSPPASSSPGPDGPSENARPNIRLYALPLSSEILNILDRVPAFQAPDSAPSHQDFYYLPSPSDPPLYAHEDTSKPRKRPRLETLFQDATQNRRLQKKRGGEGIAKFMAGDQTLPSALPSPVPPNKAQPKGQLPPPRNPLTRASTTNSIATLPTSIPPTTTHPRPTPSLRSTALSTSQRRSSLVRTSSALSTPVNGVDNPMPIPEDGGKGPIEQANKISLSRVIMAGMRMYGFELRGKKSSVDNSSTASPSAPTTTSTVTTSTNNNNNNNHHPDEYKIIYHQTYKATAFVFRTHFSRKILGQDIVRDTVDGFLGRFCRDPFADGGEQGDALRG